MGERWRGAGGAGGGAGTSIASPQTCAAPCCAVRPYTTHAKNAGNRAERCQSLRKLGFNRWLLTRPGSMLDAAYRSLTGGGRTQKGDGQLVQTGRGAGKPCQRGQQADYSPSAIAPMHCASFNCLAKASLELSSL